MIEEIAVGAGIVGIIGVTSIKQVRPSERGLIERFGKYQRFANPGLQILIPFVDQIRMVDITEDMVNAQQQEVITKDSLNAKVDAQIYFRVREDEASVKKSQYAASDYKVQIVALARTTLRAIIGTLTLTEANSDRNKINASLAESLGKETQNWGIDIVRAELKEIQPPDLVQDVMNKVVVAEKERVAAVDFATAAETKADGTKRAFIKEAEGERQSKILRAQGEAEAITTLADADAQRIKVVNEAAQKYFTANAIELKKLEVAQVVLQNSTKLIVPAGSNLMNIVGDTMGVKLLPIVGK